MTKFITGKGHFLKCVLKLKQNFKIIKRDSDNSSGKTHFSCECILHWILRRFCPGDTLWFSQFSRGRACQDCLFFLLGGASNPAAGLLTILQLEPLQSPLQATHISFICPMSFDKFPLDEQVLSQWYGWWWWWWSLISTLNRAQGGFKPHAGVSNNGAWVENTLRVATIKIEVWEVAGPSGQNDLSMA